MPQNLSLRVNNCARCQGDHPTLMFFALTHPAQGDNGEVIGTHFATCPETKKSLLLVVPADK